jgi:hypothetical protein
VEKNFGDRCAPFQINDGQIRIRAGKDRAYFRRETDDPALHFLAISASSSIESRPRLSPPP